MHKYLIYIWLAVSCLLMSCGHPETFRVEGRLADNATINLRVVYVGEHGVRTLVTAARDGEFVFEGSSARPAMVEIYDNDYRILGRVMAANGEDIEVTLDRRNPYNIKAKGNELTARWAEWLNEHAEDGAAGRNAAVAEFVGGNRESELSAVLLLTEFDASGAGAQAFDSLLNLVAPEARLSYLTLAPAIEAARLSSPDAQGTVKAFEYVLRGNKRGVFKASEAPVSLIAVCGDGTVPDSIANELKRLRPYVSDGKLQILQISTASDTSTWRRTMVTDSVNWTMAWIGGGIASRSLESLGLPTLPYFIVTDTAGHQIWRGESPGSARSAVVEQISSLKR